MNINGSDLGVLTSSDPSVVQDQRLSMDNGWGLSFRITLNITRWTGHEIFYRYNRTALNYSQLQVSQGMAIHQGGYGYLLYLLPDSQRVRPFITGGGHFSNFVPPGQSAQYGQGSTKLGGHYGGGIKVHVRPNWLFRVDFRDYIQGKPFSLPGTTGNIHLLEFSGGISFIL